jgi:predicted Zn-dependent peptidase
VVGGELNAYTTKEETCVHASILKPHLERALELIADVVFNPVFPEKEIEKEKDVILDEIHSYRDTPYEQIFDDFENIVFKGHPLGTPILGIEESIRRFRRQQLVSFLQSRYQPDRMILVVSGNHTAEEIQKLALKYFNVRKGKKTELKRGPFRNYRKRSVTDSRNISQVHYITGRTAYSLHHPKRYQLVLLNNILGGPGMNSRLNLNIREKYGYTYTIESGYHAYSDAGILHVYFATDRKNYVKVKALVKKEFLDLCTKPLHPRVFRQYQEQLSGQIALAQENRLSMMLSISKALLNFGRIVLPAEILERLRMVTPEAMMETAREFLGSQNASELIYAPQD